MNISEQDRVLENDKKMMLVSASAGSGKTYIMIKYITQLICEKKVPIKNFLVLTFTKAAALQMKERLVKNLKEQQKEHETDTFILDQIDAISTANISTIHAFCEKFLKKYANLLNLNENFSIVDENLLKSIHDDAFEKAYKRFEKEENEDFSFLVSAFKNNKEKIAEILHEVEELSNSVAERDEFLASNLKSPQDYFDKSIQFLFERTKSVLHDNLKELEKLHLNDFEFEVKQSLLPIMQCENLFEIAKADCKFPKLPEKKTVGDEIVAKLQSIKDNIMGIYGKIKGLNLLDDKNVEFQRSGKLETILIKVFLVYEQECEKIKKAKNCLDFSDLEKYMKILCTKENLFDGLEYVFVDEYQDTNKIQEKIVKNVAKNSNFVAVGDVKQGIYGFRLASSEIFLKDLNDFQEGQDSAVNFLKCNFRSTQKVLDFVNSVFKVCMTKELTGIDYFSTSMSKQAKQENFVDENCKAVNIDLIAESEKEEQQIPEVYSVKDADICKEDDNFTLLQDIKRRIVEVLSSKISEDGVLRGVRYGDIAILSRRRNGLFNQLETFLQESGIPVVSNSRNELMSQPEMKMLLSYLKIALAFDDDIACMSVLVGLYHFGVEEILAAKEDGKSLCEIVKENEKFSAFCENLQEFRDFYPVFGLKKALVRLFSKTNYRAYINLHHSNLNVFVDKFLEEVEKFDYDLPALIDYFETVKITVNAEVSVVEDAVLLTTIHDSKGLEYPIVFVINCDTSLSRFRPKVDIEVNEEFGLAVKMYDQENNKEVVSARMRAIKECEKEKDYVEEMMIFYVALTRAKNRLYLFGQNKASIFSRASLRDCDCYFDFIFYALKNAKEEFLKNENFEDENLSINLITQVQEQTFGIKQNLENAEKDEKIVEKIENYLNFSYKMNENTNFKLKESVTSLNKKNQEDSLQKFDNDNFSFHGNAVDVGNAYHLALKVVDFEKVSDMRTLNQELTKNTGLFDENLIDKNVLLKNILIIKEKVSGAKIFKEKEFIMKTKVGEILDSNVEDGILVQGVVDLFAIKDEKVVLIDYKYSNSTNDEYLINKYKNQLKLYKIAIEEAFKLQISDIFLLSLKNCKLIKLQF